MPDNGRQRRLDYDFADMRDSNVASKRFLYLRRWELLRMSAIALLPKVRYLNEVEEVAICIIDVFAKEYSGSPRTLSRCPNASVPQCSKEVPEQDRDARMTAANR